MTCSYVWLRRSCVHSVNNCKATVRSMSVRPSVRLSHLVPHVDADTNLRLTSKLPRRTRPAHVSVLQSDGRYTCQCCKCTRILTVVARLRYNECRIFSSFCCAVASPEDRASGGDWSLVAVPPLRVLWDFPEKLEYYCSLCSGKSVFVNTKMWKLVHTVQTYES